MDVKEPWETRKEVEDPVDDKNPFDSVESLDSNSMAYISQLASSSCFNQNEKRKTK